MEESHARMLPAEELQALFDGLKRRGHRILGPTVRDQAIVYDDIDGPSDLPQGWTDEQEAGRYRLVRRQDEAYFGYVVGPQSWKRFLHPPVERLWHARRDGDGIEVTPEPVAEEKLAFLGMRACEIEAMAVQDRVFLGGPHVDTRYEARRRDVFVVAVNCAVVGGTCFCASMGTGPKAEAGFDLSLTEILDGDGHRFLVEAGSAAGRELLGELPGDEAAETDLRAGLEIVARATAAMGREMPAGGVRDLLMRNLEHPRWDEVAGRCLSCGNCTLVCPTCFCTSVEDGSDLAGLESWRTQRWDSCFTLDFSYIHGGSVRSSTRSRYRQWMTHKLATWHDQFDTSGCVGCGRCITWCPVGIDITEEVHAIARSEGAGGG